jgi:hypothetical protein
MKNTESNVGYVASVKRPAQIEIAGFERADEAAHMIEWLGKGKDFRQFVVNDIEGELYAQDSNSQLLSVNCTTKPEYETKLLRQNDASQKGILTQFSVTFPIMLRVKAGNGAVWDLNVKHNYHASNLDVPGNHKVRLNFTIVSQAPV